MVVRIDEIHVIAVGLLELDAVHAFALDLHDSQGDADTWSGWLLCASGEVRWHFSVQVGVIDALSFLALGLNLESDLISVFLFA